MSVFHLTETFGEGIKEISLCDIFEDTLRISLASTDRITDGW